MGEHNPVTTSELPPGTPSQLAGSWVVIGDATLLERCAVTVVGTRSPTPRAAAAVRAAAQAADELGAPLAAGLAAGVDAWAHHSARELGVASVAWLPVCHRRLTDAARRAGDAVVAAGGALVLPADEDVELGRHAVMARNEAMALCASVLVVAQSRTRSLSMHAAACAVTAHRALVVPNYRAGDTANPRELAAVRGCRLLARDQPTTVAELGWPSSLAGYVESHLPVANAVADTADELRSQVVLLHRLGPAQPG